MSTGAALGPPRKRLIVAGVLAAALGGGAGAALLDICGPFADVPADLCPFVLEIYYLGVTAGTSASTYAPDDPLTRGQAAVFVAKSFDRAVARSGRRAALGQWWTSSTTPYASGLGLTLVGLSPSGLAADGADIWAASGNGSGNGRLTRIRASDGSILGLWPDLPGAGPVLVAMGRVFVGGLDVQSGQGKVYMIDPTQPPGAFTTVVSDVPAGAASLAFDGARLWTANYPGGSVSIVTPAPAAPWPVTTVTAGFVSPFSVLFDGGSLWAIDTGVSPGVIRRLDAAGNVLQNVGVGVGPRYAAFDGENIWVPNIGDNTVTIVRADTGTVLATLTGNGLNAPWAAGFDGQRVAVTSVGGALSLFKTADLSPIVTFSTLNIGGAPYGVCSDGINFWLGVASPTGVVARF